jgi:hypothetical protein
MIIWIMFWAIFSTILWPSFWYWSYRKFWTLFNAVLAWQAL